MVSQPNRYQNKRVSQLVICQPLGWILDNDEAHPIRCIVGTEDDKGIVRRREPPQIDSRLVPFRQIRVR